MTVSSSSSMTLLEEMARAIHAAIRPVSSHKGPMTDAEQAAIARMWEFVETTKRIASGGSNQIIDDIVVVLSALALETKRADEAERRTRHVETEHRYDERMADALAKRVNNITAERNALRAKLSKAAETLQSFAGCVTDDGIVKSDRKAIITDDEFRFASAALAEIKEELS